MRGDEETASLYYSGGSETITKQGNEVKIDLYFKNSSGGYTKFGATVYRAGSDVTIYKRGSLYRGALYKDGGSETVRLQGDLFTQELHYAGTTRANLKLATFDATSTVLAYAR